MTKDQITVTWMFYMLTAVRKRLGLSWNEFDSVLRRFRISAFLLKHYELLHYYDNEYIVEDVLKYISEQGGDPDDLRRVV